MTFKYGITHIVNCTKNENRFPTYFVYQNFDIDPLAAGSLRNPLQTFANFTNGAHKFNGSLFNLFFLFELPSKKSFIEELFINIMN